MAVRPRLEPEPEAVRRNPRSPQAAKRSRQIGGGLTIQLVRVFVENRLAVVGLAIIIFAILFCWVGPIVYPTNQTDTPGGAASRPARTRRRARSICSEPTQAASTCSAGSCTAARSRSWSASPPP